MPDSLLVTGSSGGLGLQIAVQAARAGYDVYATMRDVTKRAALDTALAAAGVKATVLTLDVSDQHSIDAAVGDVVRHAGKLDVLINNAGSGFVRTLEQAADHDIDWILDVNLRGVIRCTKAVLPHMRAARSGRVITISSVGGLVGQPFNEIYCAAKFGVEGFIESLASYVGPAFGIGFTLIEPGGIASDFAAAAMRQFTETGGMLADDYAPLLQSYIAGATARSGAGGSYQTTAEVAAVVIGSLTMDPLPVRLRTSAWSEDFTRLKTSADPDGNLLRADLIARNFGALPL